MATPEKTWADMIDEDERSMSLNSNGSDIIATYAQTYLKQVRREQHSPADAAAPAPGGRHHALSAGVRPI